MLALGESGGSMGAPPEAYPAAEAVADPVAEAAAEEELDPDGFSIKIPLLRRLKK